MKIDMRTGSHQHYIYLGDRNTDPALKNRPCTAVHCSKGKCIRGKNGNMLVSFGNTLHVVVARLLRKTKS